MNVTPRTPLRFMAVDPPLPERRSFFASRSPEGGIGAAGYGPFLGSAPGARAGEEVQFPSPDLFVG